MPDPNKVFVVHGHDGHMKEACARLLTGFGLTPILLSEQPNQSQTIIEKFEKHSAVGFAVVLLSGDDMVVSAKDSKSEASPKFRARQNVIFELGFFIGRLGRRRVTTLLKETDGFELPSDYFGVMFVTFDEQGAWKNALARELSEAGYRLNTRVLIGDSSNQAGVEPVSQLEIEGRIVEPIAGRVYPPGPFRTSGSVHGYSGQSLYAFTGRNGTYWPSARIIPSQDMTWETYLNYGQQKTEHTITLVAVDENIARYIEMYRQVAPERGYPGISIDSLQKILHQIEVKTDLLLVPSMPSGPTNVVLTQID